MTTQRTTTAILADLTLYRTARTALVMGERVTGVNRDGRGMRMATLTLDEINTAIRDLEREYAEAAAAEAGNPRRRPSNLAWKN